MFNALGQRKMARQFSDLLEPSRVLLPVCSDGKEAVIEELARFLADSHGRPDLAGVVLKGVLERECEMSTGIGRGVALPHAEIEIPIEPMAVVGVAPEGIDFEAIDDEPVRILFMLVCSEQSRDERLEILSRLSTVLRDRSAPKRIWSAGTPAEVVKIIREKEGDG